jgi:hypothetical protein
MSHIAVNSILPAEVYNRLIIDHDATQRSEQLELKLKHIPALSAILLAHGVADSVELHLLHRHFILQDGEALVHRTLEISGSGDDSSIRVDIAKATSCPESVKGSLVPLLWMASHGSLIAYEYGLQAEQPKVAGISSETWKSFSHEFSVYVHSAGIADIVSLKDKSCINGGEYVAPTMRTLFRVPMEAVNLQPGSGMLESGWKFDAAMNPNANQPECTDGHVTKTRHTSGGTVAHYHVTTEDGMDAFNSKEVPVQYTDAMWAAAKSGNFWVPDRMVDVTA